MKTLIIGLICTAFFQLFFLSAASVFRGIKTVPKNIERIEGKPMIKKVRLDWI